MMKQPDVTVITAAYNAGDFLNEAIDSVVRQTYPFWELIIVDDGSTDSTRGYALSREKSDRRIRVVTILHSGLGAARNVAIDMAKGEWVTFLDADDILSPCFIEKMMSAALDEVDVVAAPIKMFRKKISFESPEKITHEKVSTFNIVRDALFKRGKINSSMCGKLFRKTLFENSRFNENIFFEDLELFPRLMLQASSHTVVVLNSPFYGYRQHSSSFIHTLSSHSFDSLEAALRVEQFIKDHCPELENAAADRVISAAFNVLVKLYQNKIDAPKLKNRCVSSILERNISKESRLRNKIAVKLMRLHSWK